MTPANRSYLIGKSNRRDSMATVLVRLFIVVLLLLSAFLLAKLIYAVATPAGPVGSLANARASAALSAEFDPFFRLAAGENSSQTVTSLPLGLHGTRVDGATGQGSAIIATPDGKQLSYAVGEIIMPGVKLISVAGDHVTIDRGGAREQLFIDQSVPASSPTLQPPPLPTVVPTPVQVVPVASTVRDIPRPDSGGAPLPAENQTPGQPQ